MKNANKLPAIVMSIAVALAILTGSIAAPIIIRPFYYAQIDPLELERSSGLSREEIIEAYDEVLDYCIGVSGEFSAGVLPFSESGSAHFADCRTLFILDLWLFFGSMAAIALLKLYRRRHEIPRLRGHGAAFWGAAGIGAVLLVIGAAAATNFDRAFTLFHTLFFPSKDNWVLYANVDPIIRIMPVEFFRDCALTILGLILAVTVVITVLDAKNKA